MVKRFLLLICLFLSLLVSCVELGTPAQPLLDAGAPEPAGDRPSSRVRYLPVRESPILDASWESQLDDRPPTVLADVALPPPASEHLNGITYHGGPIILGGIGIYLIWYGTWADSTKTIVTDMVSHLGGSAYFRINTTYYATIKHFNYYASDKVTFRGSIDDAYSAGYALGTPYGVSDLITAHLLNGDLPWDSNALYVVIASQDVDLTDACYFWCGWHSHFALNGFDLKHALIADPRPCLKGCTPAGAYDGGNVTPNNDPAADGMVSVIAHEIEETLTDPDENAWVDILWGGENADKCAWTYGPVYPTSNGNLANMRLGDRDFLIQQNWVNADGGYCAASYP